MSTMPEQSGLEPEVAAHGLLSDSEVLVELRVKNVLTPLTYRIYADTPVAEIQNLMVRRGVSAVPVVGADHELLGVVTEADLLRCMLPERQAQWPVVRGSIPASEVMIRSVLCVSEDESLLEAARSMGVRGVPLLPVARDGELVGFLERRVVIHTLAQATAPEEASTPPTRSDHWAGDPQQRGLNL